MTAKEIADLFINYHRWTDDLGVESDQYLLAKAYLALEARMEKLERVVAAAKFTCKSWNRNREEIYRRLDVIGSVLSFDPDYRHEDKLGLSEALAQLDEAGT